jgi:DnaJ-domain-containing protein 1
MTPNADKSTNPFQILGIQPSFSISAEQIQRAYLQRLATTHPDLGLKNEDDSLDPATLNQARDTLLNDEDRANLMLELVGGPSSKDTSLPDGFLMEMMQLRSQIEEELEADPDEARPRWQQWADDRRTQTIDEISELYESLENAAEETQESIKQSIRTQLNAWRYTERLIEQLDPTYTPSESDW